MSEIIDNYDHIPKPTMARLIRQLEAAVKLANYLAHDSDCILSRREAGEPTSNGGYREKYAGTWYESRPVDKTPKCTCGLDQALSAFERVRGEGGK